MSASKSHYGRTSLKTPLSSVLSTPVVLVPALELSRAPFSPTKSSLEGRSQVRFLDGEDGLKTQSDEDQTDPARPPRVT